MLVLEVKIILLLKVMSVQNNNLVTNKTELMNITVWLLFYRTQFEVIYNATVQTNWSSLFIGLF